MSIAHHRKTLEAGLPMGAAQITRWVDELWADWLREADDPDRDLIIAELCRTWTEEVSHLDEDGRVDALHRNVVERRVRALMRTSLRLGEAALGLNTDLSATDAQHQARQLVPQIRPLANGIQALAAHPTVSLLERDVQIAALDLVYAAEGGAMSPRLSRVADAAGVAL
ncbi:MAG: hypothetical protein AB8H79_08140 [Myxococcota bacterium]